MILKSIIIGIVLLVASITGASIYNSTVTEVVHNCKVIKLEQQQIISGHDSQMHTEIRYLIITDKETFISKSSLMNGKFNNSDVFYHLEEGKTYSFKVAGVGKGFFFDYRNILKIN